MTAPTGQPVNVAAGGSQVGVQAMHAYFDTVTLPGDVQLTVGQDALPDVKYRVGVENLRSGTPGMARKLIWQAMMSGYVNNNVLFHWLVAMLSGRTVRQFSSVEIDQLKRSRSRYAAVAGDAWADGVRLIYRLLDSVPLSLATEAEPKITDIDMSLLIKQFDDLGEEQRDMVRPHLELFLTGEHKNEMWRQELERAQCRQLADNRRGRAWMFFQPIPAEVLLPLPRPESTSRADRLAKRTSSWLFVVAAGYLGWELLWHGAFLGLLSYGAAIAGGAVAAAADAEWRFLTERRRLKDELFRAPNKFAPQARGDGLADHVDKLFSRYFTRYAPARAERERWESAVAGFRKFLRDEIIEVCQDSGISANEVAWLIRYEVRQLKYRWQNERLYEYQQQLVPRPGTVAGRRAGLAILALGGIWALVALRACPLADLLAVSIAFWSWRSWLRVELEHRRSEADSEEHAQRQAAIDNEFRRWSNRLQARPKDSEMAAWLGYDRTVLLGRVLDHFHLSRSRLDAHAFVEEPAVAVRRARIEGGPLRYAKYRLLVILLAEDGVRQIRTNLDFMTGTLTIRERTSYPYGAIVSVRVLQEARRGQTFELRLLAGDPITVKLRDADSAETEPDQNSAAPESQEMGPEAQEQMPGAQEMAGDEEGTAPEVTSAADLLHLLEDIAGEGRDWLRRRDWARAWSGNDDTGAGEADA